MSPRKTAGGGEKKLQGAGMASAKALGWKRAGWGFLEWTMFRRQVSKGVRDDFEDLEGLKVKERVWLLHHIY